MSVNRSSNDFAYFLFAEPSNYMISPNLTNRCREVNWVWLKIRKSSLPESSIIWSYFLGTRSFFPEFRSSIQTDLKRSIKKFKKQQQKTASTKTKADLRKRNFSDLQLKSWQRAICTAVMSTKDQYWTTQTWSYAPVFVFLLLFFFFFFFFLVFFMWSGLPPILAS